MLKRLAPLFPGVSSVAYAVLVWTMLAHASTAVFTISLFGYATKWLDNHAWVGFAAGLVLLALAVVWPDVKPRCAVFLERLKIPRTPGDRLNEIEKEHIPKLQKCIATTEG